jgi:hypothetical protein
LFSRLERVVRALLFRATEKKMEMMKGAGVGRPTNDERGRATVMLVDRRRADLRSHGVRYAYAPRPTVAAVTFRPAESRLPPAGAFVALSFIGAVRL